jgi:Cytochrome c552
MNFRWMACSCLGASLAACVPGADEQLPVQTSGHAVAGDSTRATPIARDDTLQPGALHMVQAAPVLGWLGPGGHPFEVALRTAEPGLATARRFGTVTRRVAARDRSPNLGQYPCTACHLGRRMILADERKADAHRDLEARHPAQTGAACATCHAPDNVELLALKSGQRATLDHAYRLCAQCHFEQAEAWAGGAHGKRLDGWQGRRVVLGCADCHDPHAPALGARIPFRAPRLERSRSPQP